MNEEEKIIKKLRKSAMSYLARYEVSVHQFEKTMKRKLSNLKANLEDLDKIKIIRNLKNEMILAKFIDDKRFAETKIRSIRSQGGSERFIYAKLNEKGISNDIIKCAINTVDEGHENAEMIAAINYIKKKNKRILVGGDARWYDRIQRFFPKKYIYLLPLIPLIGRLFPKDKLLDR